MADLLSIPVVGHFRENDVMAGGQGAPFAPLYHQALSFQSCQKSIAVVNCGGIANLTLICGDEILAFDTGPGNGLLDNFVRSRTHGKEHMDTDGKYGKLGKVNQEVLDSLYKKSILINGLSYFAKQPPKSLDIGDMSLIHELNDLSLEDGCATLAFFTADTIAQSLGHLPSSISIPSLWVLCGGGWYNPNIRSMLVFCLESKIKTSDLVVKMADEMGWNNLAMEAHIFSFLALRSINKQPLSLPSTTGVPYPMNGGKHFYPMNIT
jgi:anhydro-N-acetylmuramic acid kinase